MKKRVAAAALAAGLSLHAFEFSKAGYWEAENSPRTVRSMNPGWEFSLDGFKTSKAVNLPHSIDEGEIGIDASGCVNRQQQAWYRKTFEWRRTKDKSFIHFEAIMGKSRITLNGKRVAEHFGGFLPIHIDVSDVLKDGENTIEVWCDNSDDPSYPPGKPQTQLDWTYFGGIYRDVWLVETGKAFVQDTDNGGVYVTSRLEKDGAWTVRADVHLGGEPGAAAKLFFDGKEVAAEFSPERPALWTPDEPNLHDLVVRVFADGSETDAVKVRFGIRDFTINGDGLALNGKPWRKVVGVNRHQDYPFVGMALSNSLHWRDAKKFRDAGFTCIRNAHYPQDPAFMDACDALGLFVIVDPPGWQFWNGNDPAFGERVYDDILKMVRRDRSRASLFFWEPILNETRYPADFAHRAIGIVKAETRAPNYCACDEQSKGAEEYDFRYGHLRCPEKDDGSPYFTREWGDFVDDWYAQNSPSRVAIEWGEAPMLVQAEHYTDNDYTECIRRIFESPACYIGGCMWHGTDHARGYHPDNFFGGILSYARRPKYSYYACKAMLTDKPMAFLANQLQFDSPQTFTIFSNCAYKATWLGREVKNGDRMDRAEFKNVTYEAGWKKDENANDFVIELADGSCVTNHHARKWTQICFELDTEGMAPSGDGSDLVLCVAQMCDNRRRIRRYQNEDVFFSVDGDAQIVGENPQRTRWGEAVVLIRPLSPGRIIVKAEPVRKGTHVPPRAEFAFDAARPEVAAVPGRARPIPSRGGTAASRASRFRAMDLSEVEKQQREFGAPR